MSIYTDGGVALGQKYWLGVGTWGLFLPHRLQQGAMGELVTYAHCLQKEGGLLTYGQGCGPAMSSARREALGLYAALAVEGARNIGIDNASVVLRATELLRRHGNSPSRVGYKTMETSGR